MLVSRSTAAPSRWPYAAESDPYFGSVLTNCSNPDVANAGTKLSGWNSSCSQNIILSRVYNGGIFSPGSTTPNHFDLGYWPGSDACTGGASGSGSSFSQNAGKFARTNKNRKQNCQADLVLAMSENRSSNLDIFRSGENGRFRRIVFGSNDYLEHAWPPRDAHSRNLTDIYGFIKALPDGQKASNSRGTGPHLGLISLRTPPILALWPV
jgi:hypothetical protein